MTDVRVMCFFCGAVYTGPKPDRVCSKCFWSIKPPELKTAGGKRITL